MDPMDGIGLQRDTPRHFMSSKAVKQGSVKLLGVSFKTSLRTVAPPSFQVVKWLTTKKGRTLDIQASQTYQQIFSYILRYITISCSVKNIWSYQFYTIHSIVSTCHPKKNRHQFFSRRENVCAWTLVHHFHLGARLVADQIQFLQNNKVNQRIPQWTKVEFSNSWIWRWFFWWLFFLEPNMKDPIGSMLWSTMGWNFFISHWICSGGLILDH